MAVTTRHHGSSGHGSGLTFLALAAAIVLAAPPPAVEAADPWQAGQYHDFTPSGGDRGGSVTRAAATSLKLRHAAVHRPKVNQGEEALLRAEYDLWLPSGEIDVQEIRIVRYNGARLTQLTRVIRRASGRFGSDYQLRIPEDAAPGLYTVATLVGPVGGASPEVATAAFYVDEVEKQTAADEGDGIKIRIWADKPKYAIGEPFRLLFETTKDSYVTLVNIGTTGAVTILYPNRFSGRDQVKAGIVYSVPGAGDNYEITLNGPAGIELVYALVTTQPLKFSEADFGRGDKAGRSDVLTRDLNIAAKRLPVKEHTKALLEIEVE